MTQMPPVWSGRRRYLLTMLCVFGALQAVLAVIMSLTVDGILNPEVLSDYWDILGLLVSVVGIGVIRWLERVLAEDVGQDYVTEQRKRLVFAALADPDYRTSLGVTVTRTSNDLTALRNWVALGIVPLVTGIPVIGIIVSVLLVSNWKIGLAVLVPLATIGVFIPLLAQVTLHRAREVRKRRGRMSARIADTVMASESVRASGAISREINAIDRESTKLASASVDRAWISGLTRALTATAASLCTVFVVIEAYSGVVTSGEVASTLLLLGILSVSVTDMGRVVEYRQNFRAASRILAPLLQHSDELKEEEARKRREWRAEHAGVLSSDSSLPRGVRVDGLVVEGRRVPDVVAKPGEKIRIVSEDPHLTRQVVAAVASLSEPGIATVDGHDIGDVPGQVRRELIGMASEHVPLERGSIKRLVSYRVPGASTAEVREQLERVGLTELVDSHERGVNRQLKNDGQPWSVSNVMLLKVARAMMGTPPLLILEGVDTALDTDATQRLWELLAEYDGVVLFTSAVPQGEYREWDIDDGVLVHGELIDASGDPAYDEE